MKIRLVQIVIEVDGQLCLVPIPAGRKDLALGLIQSLFDDGKIQAVKLPIDYRLETLGVTP